MRQDSERQGQRFVNRRKLADESVTEENFADGLLCNLVCNTVIASKEMESILTNLIVHQTCSSTPQLAATQMTESALIASSVDSALNLLC